MSIAIPKKPPVRLYGVIPIGDKNGVNLTFEAPDKFIPESFQVYLSGINLDLGLDYFIHGDNKTFTIILAPENPSRLNSPPFQDESLKLNYTKF